MARTRQETDELLVALIERAEADPNAALVVATVNDGSHETGTLITLGHAGCTVAPLIATVAGLLDVAEEKILAGEDLAGPGRSLQCIRDGRAALGILGSEVVQ